LLVTTAVIHGSAVHAISTEKGPCGIHANSARQGSVWLVSTRHLGSWLCEEEFARGLDIQRYDGQQGWQPASLSEFHASEDADTPTLVYVHGNRFDWREAIQHGWVAHNTLVPGPDAGPPVRFVIWSWPSDRIRGLLRDVRVKAQRAHCEAYYLAQFLSGTDPQTPPGLFGFSYGARVITGALHLLGGGQLCGMKLDRPLSRAPARVVLSAAAVHNDWLFPSNYHGRMIDQTGRMLLLYNSRDAVLKRYRFLDRRRHTEALGYTGLPGCLADHWIHDRLTQIDAAPYIGRSHREISYFCCSPLMALYRHFLLGE